MPGSSGSEHAPLGPVAEQLEALAAGGEERSATVPLRRAATLTAILGAVFGVLTLLALWLHSTIPGARAEDRQLIDYYEAGDNRLPVLVGLYIMPFAGIAFIWFMVALRGWITAVAHRVDVLLSNVQLVSGIVFLTLFFAAGASSGVMAASVEFSDGVIDPEVARMFPAFGSTLFIVFAARMAAMFVITTTSIGRGSGALPKWFVWAGYLVGLFLLLSATLQPLLFLVFPIWTLVLSALLLLRARQLPKEITVAEFRAERP